MGHPRATPSASRDRPLPRLDRAPARRLGHRRGARAMIRFVGLRKEYGPTVAVAGLDFTIEQGRVFGFIGPNGAAKTTTGYLPDHPFLYDKLTGGEFLRFVGGLYGLGGGELERRSAELLAGFGLAERAAELTETYSHGMKQRLALAAALVHRPRI